MLSNIAKKSPLFSGKKKAVEENSGPAWKILIVDDEPDVHTVTKLALSRFKLDNRTLQFLNAYSGEEAMQVLRKEDNIAMAFVDVVMENDHAGLELVRWIREDHQNKAIRLILRTGQPGQAPEEDVIVNYDINDYKAKAELDSRKLVTSVYSALRSYRDIIQIEEAKEIQIRHRKGLERVVEATSGLFELRTLQHFADGLLTQVATLLNFDSETLLLSCNSIDTMSDQVNANELHVLAGTGKYADYHNKNIPDNIKQKLLQALEEKNCIYEKDCFVGYFPANTGWINLMYMDGINKIDDLDKQLIDIFAVNVGVAFENLLLNKEVEDTQSELILRLGDVVESRSKEAANHVKRMSAYCYELALIAGMDLQEAKLIKHASPMHDIGKIATPDAVLLKAGKLDAAEWSIMRQHPQVGHQILAKSERPILKAASIIALQHHEKYDGTGYPSGIKGEDIHIFARIVSIADVFDALSHARCYKPAWPLEEVLKVMEEGSGTHFDPVLLKLFIENVEVFNALKEEWHD